MLVCASTCSCELGLIGKDERGWLNWLLDEVSRAELPLDANQHETWPLGISIDFSSILPVKIGKYKTHNICCKTFE